MLLQADSVLGRVPAAYLAQGVFVLPGAGLQSERVVGRHEQQEMAHASKKVKDAGEVCLGLKAAAAVC